MRVYLDLAHDELTLEPPQTWQTSTWYDCNDPVQVAVVLTTLAYAQHVANIRTPIWWTPIRYRKAGAL